VFCISGMNYSKAIVREDDFFDVASSSKAKKNNNKDRKLRLLFVYYYYNLTIFIITLNIKERNFQNVSMFLKM